jgi:hypothetical protein
MNSASFTQQFPGQTAATDAAARFWDATRIVVSTLLSTREYMAQFHQVEEMMRHAHRLENSQPERAAAIRQQAIDLIH